MFRENDWLREHFVTRLLEDFSVRTISPRTFKSGIKNTSIVFTRNIGLENAKLFLQYLSGAVELIEKEEA